MKGPVEEGEGFGQDIPTDCRSSTEDCSHAIVPLPVRFNVPAEKGIATLFDDLQTAPPGNLCEISTPPSAGVMRRPLMRVEWREAKNAFFRRNSNSNVTSGGEAIRGVPHYLQRIGDMFENLKQCDQIVVRFLLRQLVE